MPKCPGARGALRWPGIGGFRGARALIGTDDSPRATSLFRYFAMAGLKFCKGIACQSSGLIEACHLGGRNRSGSTHPGRLIALFLFFPGKEKESKETARAPLNPARRRGGRSTRKLTRLRIGYGGFRQSARFFPSAPPMLGAGQWENQNQRLQTIFKLTSKG